MLWSLVTADIELWATYTRYVILVAAALRQESVPDLPGEDGGALALVMGNLGHHIVGSYPGLAAPNGAGPDGARLVVATQDFADTAIGHLQDARDIAGPRPAVRKLHDTLTRGVWQRAPIDKHAT